MKVREIHPRPTPTPFPLDDHAPGRESLQYLAPDQMSAADRDLVAANETEIERRAELQGFRLDAGQGSWDTSRLHARSFQST